MGFFHDYPYTDFHEINLDWILKQIMALHRDWSEFKAANTITNAGAWDITQQYQAWTIVSDNNAGYISLQAVPAGIDISNTDYWGLIADYDIVISDLADRLTDLENEMTTVSAESADAFKLAKIAVNRKIMIVADSYAEVAGTPFTQQLVTRYGADRITVLSASGYGFTNGNWYDLIQANESSITDKDSYSVVLFAGGSNDVSASYVQIQSAINTTVAYVKSIFKNAKVVLACIGGSAPSAVNDSAFYLQENVRRAYNNTNGSWTYLENSECPMMCAAYFQADGVHPNQDGSNALFRMFVNFIDNYSTETLYPITDITLTLESPFQSHTSFFMRVRQLNQLFICRIGRPVFTLSSTSITENGLYHIGTQDNLILKTGREINFMGYGYIKNNTKMYPALIEITMRCNDVWFRPHVLDKSSTSWETITNVTEIGLYPNDYINAGQF